MYVSPPSRVRARVPRWGLPLREWQREACDAWWKTKPDDALIVACPGAGKTRFAMRLAHALFEAGEVARTLIVVPKDHLKTQVARSMVGAGIVLEPRFENSTGVLPSDLHGAVVSYQQVAFAPQTFRRLVREVPTLVVLDEIHHAGDDATWGRALRDAFDHARYRVAMSGTPFRSDGTPIPFVTYDRGLCMPDYAYDYGRALNEGVCRPLVFPLVGVNAEWVSRDGTTIEASFDTALENRRQESERLRTALTQDDWMGTVISQAHSRLMTIRRDEQADAGGLIVSMNQEHAKYVAKLVHRITGHEPLVVISADEDASAKIRRFGDSKQPWIVAVHMVSEGVDIPRLRVGVYATNVGTPMYFRQFCGRFVRSNSTVKSDHNAYVFMPDDPALRPLAAAIHIEVQGHLKARREQPMGAGIPLDAPQPDAQTDDFFTPIAAQAIASDVLHGHPSLFDEPIETFTEQAQPDEIRSPFATAAYPVTTVVEEPTRKKKRGDALASPLSEPGPGDLLEEKRKLRREINVLVARVREQFSVDHKKIHGSLNARFGGSIAAATKPELERRRNELIRWVTKHAYDGFR